MSGSFTITHTIKKISKVKEDVPIFSKPEYHFGIPWKLQISKKSGFLAFEIFCWYSGNDKAWSIQSIDTEFKIVTFSGKLYSKKCNLSFYEKMRMCGSENKRLDGLTEFIKWDEMIKDYCIDDHLIVEVNVKNLVKGGMKKQKLWKFDQSMEAFSDVVLKVEEEKFYVAKLYLSSQSTYFEALFLRNFDESKQSEIEIKDVKSEDFQNFLELLHGESPIDESTIEGIVHLADMCDAKLAIRKCEEFLIENSEKTLKEKLKLAHRYNLNKCLSKITTASDIRSVLSHDTNEMDPSVVGALLQKSLTLIP
ncbi:hypothetical protein B9Z55_007088 [Caenorhabditis nigoni]|uniref:BTB domain-containing protein n=1 Tax=Caenorhabditis nigoni TaxID=1611254 RepID=A0A2G5V7Z6_9PELO|nr:hypothetical protein B9Z55_007088 [Caenorhabditis nigoni]